MSIPRLPEASPFVNMLAMNMQDAIRTARRNEVIGMTVSTLQTVTHRPSEWMTGAPTGTDSPTHYSRIFAETIARLPKSFANFITA